MRRSISAFMFPIFVLAGVHTASADAVEDFYRNKRIEFIAAGEAASIQDTWARLFSRHLPKYLPGNPTFVVRSVPGSGHIKAADYLFNIAPKDGSTIGTFSNSIVSGYMMKLPGLTFDTTTFEFLGSPITSYRGCAAKAGAGVQTGEDLFTRDLIVGGTGASGGISATPTLLAGLLGMRFKLVEGYQGAPQLYLAMERGEVEGACNTMAGFENTRPGWIKEGRIKVLFTLEKEPMPGMNAPSVYQFTKTDEQRRIIAFFNSNLEIGLPFVAPPGVPADRLAALRKAFTEAMKDKEFLQDAEKAKLEIAPFSGEEQARRVRAMAETPQAIIDKTGQILASNAAAK